MLSFLTFQSHASNIFSLFYHLLAALVYSRSLNLFKSIPVPISSCLSDLFFSLFLLLVCCRSSNPFLICEYLLVLQIRCRSPSIFPNSQSSCRSSLLALRIRSILLALLISSALLEPRLAHRICLILFLFIPIFSIPFHSLPPLPVSFDSSKLPLVSSRVALGVSSNIFFLAASLHALPLCPCSSSSLSFIQSLPPFSSPNFFSQRGRNEGQCHPRIRLTRI